MIYYIEGVDVGYCWFVSINQILMFVFGYGLFYISFEYCDLVVMGGYIVYVSFSVINMGDCSGVDVLQLYMIVVFGELWLWLLGFEWVEFEFGQIWWVRIEVDL